MDTQGRSALWHSVFGPKVPEQQPMEWQESQGVAQNFGGSSWGYHQWPVWTQQQVPCQPITGLEGGTAVTHFVSPWTTQPVMQQQFVPYVNGQQYYPVIGQGHTGQVQVPQIGQVQVPQLSQFQVPLMGQGHVPYIQQGYVPQIVQGHAPFVGQGQVPLIWHPEQPLFQGQVYPYMGQFQLVGQLPGVPLTPQPFQGQASPEALYDMRRIGLEYDPRGLVTPQPKAVPHPASIFPPATDPVAELRTTQPGKYVLVDVDRLATVLRKSRSAELTRKWSCPFQVEREAYQNRTMNRSNFCQGHTVEPSWRSRSAEFLLGNNRNYSACPAYCNYSNDLDELNKRLERHTQELRHLGQSRSFNRITGFTQHQNSGPPRNNSDPDTALGFFGRFHDRRAAALKYNQRPAQTAGNLPYRFPSQTTLSLYPTPTKRSRSSEARFFRNSRTDGDICRVIPNAGCRNLSVDIVPFRTVQEQPGIWDRIMNLVRTPAPSPVKRTPSGYFDAGVTLTRSDYFCEPHCRQLNRRTTATGQCFVTGFVIGHTIWGELKFEDTFDISGLNLDELVEFGQSSVLVYPPCHGRQIPPVGEGLNRPATVTLRRVFPTNPITQRSVTEPGKIRHLNFEDQLKQKVESYRGTFVSYDPAGGVWTFKIPYLVPNSIRPYYSTLY